MNSDQATLAVIDALEGLGVPYMVVGSLSSNYYGIARSTQDADFVVEMGHLPIAQLAARLGPGIRLDDQMSFETVTGTSKYVFRVADSPFKIEVFLLSDDAHDRERFGRRRRAEVAGRSAYVPAAEDVVITK